LPFAEEDYFFGNLLEENGFGTDFVDDNHRMRDYDDVGEEGNRNYLVVDLFRDHEEVVILIGKEIVDVVEAIEILNLVDDHVVKGGIVEQPPVVVVVVVH
jgi:hypothetical protein